MASVPIPTSAEIERARRRRREILADVRETLFRSPRELSPKYFYDERGSELFEEITRLPEYYVTRAEREILVARAGEIVDVVRPHTLVELGAGSAAKTRLLLNAMTAAARTETAPEPRPYSLGAEGNDRTGVAYVPVDVSEDFLNETARALQLEYPGLDVVPVVADIGVSLDVPEVVGGPVLFAFLGSTIGNFAEGDAIALLRRIRGQMRPRDRLLLGTDLHKDASILNPAYNDARGVTAEFNRNMLRALNAELGADFVPERYAHRAFYDESARRIEMHLDAIGDQTVHIPGLPTLVLHDGESIRTELSHKYDRASVAALLGASCMRIARWYTDASGFFALSIAEPVA
jgi:L-histidine N-alpha-methyltransferase